MKKFSEKYFHAFFEVGVIVKGAIAVAETLLGAVFYLTDSQVLSRFIISLIGDETSNQPLDILWRYIIHTFQGFALSSQQFWAFIFLSHGLVKVLLIWALLKDKIWAYPVSAAVFVLFIIYQIYSLFFIPSLFLGALTALDMVIVFLIVHEYGYKQRGASSEQDFV